MTQPGQSNRDVLLFWVRTADGEVWIQDTVDCAAADDSCISETRKEVYDRASEYSGQVAEQVVRVPVPEFGQAPLVEGQVIE